MWKLQTINLKSNTPFVFKKIGKNRSTPTPSKRQELIKSLVNHGIDIDFVIHVIKKWGLYWTSKSRDHALKVIGNKKFSNPAGYIAKCIYHGVYGHEILTDNPEMIGAAVDCWSKCRGECAATLENHDPMSICFYCQKLHSQAISKSKSMSTTRP